MCKIVALPVKLISTISIQITRLELVLYDWKSWGLPINLYLQCLRVKYLKIHLFDYK